MTDVAFLQKKKLNVLFGSTSTPFPSLKHPESESFTAGCKMSLT